jgi:hypothetical protein
MSLKVATLLAAITQLLTVFCGIFTYARMLQHHTDWKYNAEFLVTDPIYLIADIMLVVFLFTLFARQKSN